jgi:hypothetical protein
MSELNHWLFIEIARILDDYGIYVVFLSMILTWVVSKNFFKFNAVVIETKAKSLNNTKAIEELKNLLNTCKEKEGQILSEINKRMAVIESVNNSQCKKLDLILEKLLHIPNKETR